MIPFLIHYYYIQLNVVLCGFDKTTYHFTLFYNQQKVSNINRLEQTRSHFPANVDWYKCQPTQYIFRRA